MAKKDYYEILGLRKDCSTEDVKKSYHKLALKWHPDKHCNKNEAETKFNEIHKAYSILGDNSRRNIYDKYGHDGLDLEDDCTNLSKNNCKNKFYQKGFQGTDKSAFDILKGIFQNEEEEDFFCNFDDYGISQKLQSTMRSFINDNVIESDEEDSFCKNYKPTFMNSNFNLISGLFPKQDYCNEGTSQEYFSFTSMDSTGKVYSKTKKTVVKNGKVKTSTKERYRNGDEVIENEQTDEYNCKRSPGINLAFNFDFSLDKLIGDESNSRGLNKNSKPIRKEMPAEKKSSTKKNNNKKSATK